MAESVSTWWDKYDYVIKNLADSRTKDFPLIASPVPMILIISVYLWFCVSYGPGFMSKRKAYQLKYPVMLYNIVQIGLSCKLVYEGLLYFMSKDYNFVCDPLIESTTDPRLLRVAYGAWLYFFAKITELLDTVFFVLRKKQRQISFLHLYHHSLVVFCGWMFCKYFPGGPVIFLGTLNSCVHVFMYTYYFLSGLGPKYQKYLWWKKYITQIQLIQFVMIIIHNTVALFHDCNYPKLVHVFILFNTGLVFVLFVQFYIENYFKNSKKKDYVNGKPIGKTALNRKKLSIGQ